jgi:hypothetical protein
MNMLLAAAPRAEVIQGPLACMLSLNDMCDRPPVVASDDPLDTGGHRLRFIATPHVPHNWEAGLWFDEATSTLLARRPAEPNGQPRPTVRVRHRRPSDRRRAAVSRHRADLDARSDAASTRRAKPHHARGDARRVLHRRRSRPVAWPGRRLCGDDGRITALTPAHPVHRLGACRAEVGGLCEDATPVSEAPSAAVVDRCCIECNEDALDPHPKLPFREVRRYPAGQRSTPNPPQANCGKSRCGKSGFAHPRLDPFSCYAQVSPRRVGIYPAARYVMHHVKMPAKSDPCIR